MRKSSKGYIDPWLEIESVAGHELSLRAIASGSGSAFVAIGAARGTEAVSLSQDVVTVL
jgi:hypothetical protein